MILVSFFSEDNGFFFLMKTKCAMFSNIKVTKIERPAFFFFLGGGGRGDIQYSNSAFLGLKLMTALGLILCRS